MGHSNHLLSPKETHATKKKGNFFVFFSENSTKFAKYFENLAKFSISQNWKGKKNPTKQLIETFGIFLIAISILQFTSLY